MVMLVSIGNLVDAQCEFCGAVKFSADGLWVECDQTFFLAEQDACPKCLIRIFNKQKKEEKTKKRKR